MLVTVKNGSNTAIDLRAEDDAVGEAAEVVLGEIKPLMYLVTNRGRYNQLLQILVLTRQTYKQRLEH